MKRCLLLLSVLILIPLHSLGKLREGKAFVDSLMQELPKYQEEDTNRVTFLNTLSYAYESLNPAEGIKYGILGRDLAQQLNWKLGIGWANNSLGINYYRKGDYPTALGYFFKALKIHEELGNKTGIITVTGNIGNIYEYQSNYAEALNYYQRTLSAYRALGDNAGVGRMLGNIALAYMNQKNYDQALTYNLMSLKSAEETGNKGGMANIYGNMGTLYCFERNYNKALEYTFKELAIANELGAKNMIAVSMGNIGEYYLEVVRDTGKTIVADSYVSNSKKVNLAKAIDYMQQGVNICRETSFLGPLQEFLQKLSDAQYIAGNYKEGIDSYKQFVAIRDSVFSTENNIKIGNLETERQLELKDKQILIDKLEVAKKRNERVFFIAGILGLIVTIIIILRGYRVLKTTNGLLTIEKQKVEERTEKLNRANGELTSALNHLKETQVQLVETGKQKENEMIRNRISQDIHDDISSELTRISWMSEMAKLKAVKANAGDMSPLLEKITLASRETIRKLSEIIWAVNPQNDNLENFIGYMRDYIAKFFTDTSVVHNIDFPAQVPLIYINPELKRNLFLTVKEALNNAVKYAQASHISVNLIINSDTYVLTVADDGVGIDEQNIQGGGNGLKNMRNRMDSVRGSCSIQRSDDGGTIIILEGVLY